MIVTFHVHWWHDNPPPMEYMNWCLLAQTYCWKFGHAHHLLHLATTFQFFLFRKSFTPELFLFRNPMVQKSCQINTIYEFPKTSKVKIIYIYIYIFFHLISHHVVKWCDLMWWCGDVSTYGHEKFPIVKKKNPKFGY